MKTIITSALCIASVLACGALTGCKALHLDESESMGGETDDAKGQEETDPGEIVGEAPEALEDPAAPEAVGLPFRLKLKHSGECIEPVRPQDNNSAPVLSGAALVQRPCKGGPVSMNDPQAFVTYNPGGGTVAGSKMIGYGPSVQNGVPTLCMHLAGGNMGDGGALALFSCKNTLAHQWFTADALDSTGYGGVRSALSGKCMTVIGALGNDGAIIYLYGSACTADHTVLRRDDGSNNTPPVAW